MRINEKWTIILSVLFSIIFVVCGVLLTIYYVRGYRERKALEELKIQTGISVQNQNSNFEYDKNIKSELLHLQLLKTSNYDLIGWIKINDTKINYPVMQTLSDPQYYLHYDFNKRYSKSGLPFLDAQCNLENSKNLIIHGHNMKDGSIFAGLMKYTNKDFYEQYKFIFFYTLKEKLNYEVVSVFHIQTANAKIRSVYNNMDSGNVKENLRLIKSLSIYDTGIQLKSDDKFLMLSTCSYNRPNERLVIFARQIK